MLACTRVAATVAAWHVIEAGAAACELWGPGWRCVWRKVRHAPKNQPFSIFSAQATAVVVGYSTREDQHRPIDRLSALWPAGMLFGELACVFLRALALKKHAQYQKHETSPVPQGRAGRRKLCAASLDTGPGLLVAVLTT